MSYYKQQEMLIVSMGQGVLKQDLCLWDDQAGPFVAAATYADAAVNTLGSCNKIYSATLYGLIRLVLPVYVLSFSVYKNNLDCV